MKRRHALSVLGSAAVAGCLSGGPSGGTTTTDDGAGSDSDRCPSFGERVTRVVCGSADDPPLAITPAEQSGTLPTTDLSFELANRTSATFRTNFYGWRVWKLVDGSWFHVAPRMWPEPLMSLSPGERHSWHLTVDNTDLDREIPRSEGTENVTVVGLGAGRYAFGTSGWFESADYEDQTGIAARFELNGDPLELTAAGLDDATVERDGDTVVVDDYPDDEEHRANYTVTRVDSPADGAEFRELIVEQVLRDAPLRNALAHFEPGARRVELRTETGTFPPFGIDEPRHVSYDGRNFRIETEWEGDRPD